MAAYSYCFKCSVLLREKDFAKGKAFKVGENVACDKCAAGLVPVEKKRETAVRTRGTSVRVKAADAPPPEPEAPTSSSSRRKWGLIAGISGIVVGTALLLPLFMPKSKPEEPPPAAGTPPAPAPTVEPVKLSARERSAREALDAARRAAKEKPDDLSGQARAFEELTWAWEGTAAAEEARKEWTAVKAKQREAAGASLAALDAEIAGRVAREEFGAALDTIEQATRKLDVPEWIAGLSSRRADVDSKARARLADLTRKASEHKAKGEAAEVDRVLAQVEAWKLPALLAKLKADVDAVAPGAAPVVAAPPVVEKPRSAEGKAWLDAWRASAAKAGARDFATASAELKKAAAELREEDVKSEAAGDVEDLRALGELVRAILETAAALPAGKPLAVEVRGADGPRRLAGVVARNGRERVELRTGKGPVYAEWSEATSAGLAGLRPRKPEETRLLALLALLEGEVGTAKSLLGEATASVSAKAWAYAADAKGKVPPVPREEGHARELFYAAEREFAAMETRGLAVEKYRTLKNELAATSLARGELERILRRSEACKEYVLTAADARLSGTFKRVAGGPAVSAKDSDAEQANDNALDLEFYALPGTSYRAWLQLGGCCREVFSFFLQGTEMTASDKGKKIAIEPESGRAEWVPSTLSSLKKEHKDHAKNKEPKAPARWEWVPLNLPKYATPGLKKIRLMTYQQGFGFQQAVISSTRTAAPKPAEVEELAKARAADVVVIVGDPDLVLHWTFDEAAGPFQDQMGSDVAGAPAGAVKRVPGRVGGAAELDGTSGHVAGKDTPDLRLVGDMTIAFWMRKDAENPDWTRLVGKGAGSNRNYGVWEEPGEGKRILWQVMRDPGGGGINHQSIRTVEVGKWHHVACVRRGGTGAIYLDGRKDSEAPFDGNPSTSDVPVTVGFGGGAGHGYFKGAVDDVRIYRRALKDEEVLLLFEAGS